MKIKQTPQKKTLRFPFLGGSLHASLRADASSALHTHADVSVNPHAAKRLRRFYALVSILVLFCLLCPLAFSQGFSVAAGAPQAVSDAVQQAIPDAWQTVVDDAPMTAEEFKTLSPAGLLQRGWDALRSAVTAPMRLLAQLCGVLILAAVAKSLFVGGGETAALLDTVVTLSVFTVCSPVILGLLAAVQTSVEQSRDYLASFIPVFTAVLISCGQVGTSAVYSGFFFAFSTLASHVLCRGALPLVRIFLALHAANAVGGGMDFARLTGGISKWMKWLLTLCATVFTMVLGLQSVLAQSADSFALKTGKFLVGTGVPVVGRAVSDAMGSVFAGLKLMKGTVGFAAVAVIAAAFVPILIQCFVYHLVFSAGAMVAGATDSPKTAQLFDGLAQCASLFVSMIFFFALVVISATMLMILLGTGG